MPNLGQDLHPENQCMSRHCTWHYGAAATIDDAYLDVCISCRMMVLPRMMYGMVNVMCTHVV